MIQKERKIQVEGIYSNALILPIIEGSHPTRQKETIRDNGVIPNDYDNEKFGDA